LKSNPDIIIRKADKTNLYVILDREDYKNKLDDILNDESKFTPLEEDPSNHLKNKLNKIITTNNAISNYKKLPKLIGEFHAGYIYGNCKIHKNAEDPPLRPIISQIPAPSYSIAKEINKIIEPYLPSKFILKSTDEFLDLLSVVQPKGILTSLDAENLYTNVPLDETINIILDNVYRNEIKPAPNLPESTLKSLLEICTKEAPFRNIDGKIFQQTNGIAMGSPLGCVFANFYMTTLENQILQNLNWTPNFYGRYIDDIILIVDNEEQLLELKEKFTQNSVLNFTHEIGHRNLSFLDVNINFDVSDNIITSVYTKETSTGQLLNYNSECPDKYKRGVIMNLLHRGRKISTSPDIFIKEIDRLKQIFSNNNYPQEFINKCIDEYHKTIEERNHREIKPKIKVYYENQFNEQYKKDEKIIKEIVKKHVKPNDPNEELKVIIYYKNLKTKNLIMKNDISQNQDNMLKNWSIYKYKCHVEDCELRNPTYVGQTRNTIRKRLEQHCNDGAIKEHLQNSHKISPIQKDLEDNTIPIKQFLDLPKLKVYEALLILHENPNLNRQKDNFVNPLKLYSRLAPRNYENNQLPNVQNTRHSYNLRSSVVSLS